MPEPHRQAKGAWVPHFRRWFEERRRNFKSKLSVTVIELFDEDVGCFGHANASNDFGTLP